MPQKEKVIMKTTQGLKEELIGKTWYIPEDAQKPERANKKNDTPTLLQILRDQKSAKMTGGSPLPTPVKLLVLFRMQEAIAICMLIVANERILCYK